jgi:prepilin peptidase CpaA
METVETSSVSTIILLVMLISAVYSDLRRHRISNMLVIMILFLGLASQLGSAGSPGIVSWAGGFAVGLAIFLPFYIGGGMGAGDVKLMAAVGGFLGPISGTVACGFALLAGLPLVAIALTGRIIHHAAQDEPELHTTGTFTSTGTFKALSKHKPKNKPISLIAREGKSERIPYAAAIAAGALGGLWWSGRIEELAGVLLA